MSARAPVQITTAAEYELGVPGRNGTNTPRPEIAARFARRGARGADAASVAHWAPLRGRPFGRHRAVARLADRHLCRVAASAETLADGPRNHMKTPSGDKVIATSPISD
jgi:hypothetical protein